MQANWDRAIGSVLHWEGGQVLEGPGGATNRGVSLTAWRDEHPGATVQDLFAITADEAKDFYARRFARPVGFYQAQTGLDVVLLHAGVMFGVVGALRMLQASLGFLETGKLDHTLFDSVFRPLEAARGLIIRLMRAKMHEKSVVKNGAGWAERFVDIDGIAVDLAAKPIFTQRFGIQHQ